MSLNMFSPSPLGLCGTLSIRLASSSLVSIEICRSDRLECDLDARDADLVASSALGESDRFISSDRLEVLDNDLCASSERLECRDVERSSRLSWLSHALPLRAGMNVVEDPVSGMENKGGGVSSWRSRVRRSISSSMLSPLSLRPSEGMMVVEPEV